MCRKFIPIKDVILFFLLICGLHAQAFTEDGYFQKEKISQKNHLLELGTITALANQKENSVKPALEQEAISVSPKIPAFSEQKETAPETSPEQSRLDTKEGGSAVLPDEDLSKSQVESQPQEIEGNIYKLRMGDKLLISIYGEVNTHRVVTVDYSGKITYLLIPPCFVLGKTIDEARELLNAELKKKFRFAFVTITPVEFGGRFYTVLGQVVSPGMKPFQGSETILSAICRCGGFVTGYFRSQTVELADLKHAFLARNGSYISVDFEKLFLEGDISQNVRLESGDYIYVPSSLEKEIYILGEVQIPTTLGFLNTVSLVEALSHARGVTSRASSRALIIRGSLTNPIKLEVDIKRILTGLEKDLYLQPGDIVYVPPMRLSNLKEMYQAGVRAFVSIVATVAGVKYFKVLHPGAQVLQPVITPSTSTPIVTPVPTP